MKARDLGLAKARAGVPPLGGVRRIVARSEAPVGFRGPRGAVRRVHGHSREVRRAGERDAPPHSRRTGACQVRWRPAQRRADGQVVQPVAFSRPEVNLQP